jgi:hypothetical protein
VKGIEATHQSIFVPIEEAAKYLEAMEDAEK